MVNRFKFFALKLVFLLVISLIAAGAGSRPGLSIFKGKMRNVGAQMDKYLKYVKDSSNSRGFKFVVVLDKNDASTFTVEMTKLSCQTGEPLQQDFYGSLGEFYVANIKTPDNKFLVYDEDKKSVQAVNNIPKPKYANYAWLVFYCTDVDEYIFYPLFDRSLVLQKFTLPDEIDVIPLYGEKDGKKTSGRDFIYWKFIKE